MSSPNTGDTPHLAVEPALVDHDMGTGHNPGGLGDRPVAGEVHLVEDTSTYKPPTAGELRADGYLVPDDVNDTSVPTIIESDQPMPQGEVRLIDEPVPPASDSLEEPEPAEAEASTVAVEEEGEAEAAAEDPQFLAGREAALNEQPRSSNPHDGRRAEGKAWFRGYDSVEEE